MQRLVGRRAAPGPGPSRRPAPRARSSAGPSVERDARRAARAAAWSCRCRSGRGSRSAPASRSRGRRARARSVPRCTTACSSRTTTSPLRADGASWSRSSQPSHGFSTDLEPVDRPLGDLRLRRLLLAALRSSRWRMFLSVSPLRLTLRLPCSDHAFCVRDRSSSADRFGPELVVARVLLAPGEVAGRDVVAPRARVLHRACESPPGARGSGRRSRRGTRGRATRRRPRRRRLVHELLEPVEAGEVEVVRGLVEQEHVEAAQQDRGERGARRLPAGEHARPRRRAGRRRARDRRTPRRCAASRSSPPSARNWSSASVYASAGVGSVASATVSRSSSALAAGDAGAPAEVRRAASRPAGRRSPGAGSRRSATPAPARPRPRRGATWPARTRSSVVLPIPFGPTMPSRSPAATETRHVVQHQPPAERDRDAPGRQHARRPYEGPRADALPGGFRSADTRSGSLGRRSGRRPARDRAPAPAPSRGPG